MNFYELSGFLLFYLFGLPELSFNPLRELCHGSRKREADLAHVEMSSFWKPSLMLDTTISLHNDDIVLRCNAGKFLNLTPWRSMHIFLQ